MSSDASSSSSSCNPFGILVSTSTESSSSSSSSSLSSVATTSDASFQPPINMEFAFDNASFSDCVLKVYDPSETQKENKSFDDDDSKDNNDRKDKEEEDEEKQKQTIASFYVSKVILAARSGFFKGLFTTGMEMLGESKAESWVAIKKADLDGFKHLLRFLYGTAFPFETEEGELLKMLTLADQFQMEEAINALALCLVNFPDALQGNALHQSQEKETLTSGKAESAVSSTVSKPAAISQDKPTTATAISQDKATTIMTRTTAITSTDEQKKEKEKENRVAGCFTLGECNRYLTEIPESVLSSSSLVGVVKLVDKIKKTLFTKFGTLYDDLADDPSFLHLSSQAIEIVFTNPDLKARHENVVWTCFTSWWRSVSNNEINTSTTTTPNSSTGAQVWIPVFSNSQPCSFSEIVASNRSVTQEATTKQEARKVELNQEKQDDKTKEGPKEEKEQATQKREKENEQNQEETLTRQAKKKKKEFLRLVKLFKFRFSQMHPLFLHYCVVNPFLVWDIESLLKDDISAAYLYLSGPPCLKDHFENCGKNKDYLLFKTRNGHTTDSKLFECTFSNLRALCNKDERRYTTQVIRLDGYELSAFVEYDQMCEPKKMALYVGYKSTTHGEILVQISYKVSIYIQQSQGWTQRERHSEHVHGPAKLGMYPFWGFPDLLKHSGDEKLFVDDVVNWRQDNGFLKLRLDIQIK